MDSLSPEEKRDLIERKYIDPNMIANRLKNVHISMEEREVLEEYL
jgi:hypothetical protein